MSFQTAFFRLILINMFVISLALMVAPSPAGVVASGDNEYLGAFEPQLFAKAEDMDQVTFQPIRDLAQIRSEKPIEKAKSITAGWLYHAPSDNTSIRTLLIE